jgi:DNA repair photolyase
MITKNVTVTRDIDILGPLADLNLIGLNFSVTTLDEKIRRKLEPRTASAKAKLAAIQKLSERGIPVRVMIGPVIPGLNDHEIPGIIKAVSKAGAYNVGYTMVRLNGAIGTIFEDWIRQAFPDRAEKVLNQIKGAHNGTLNDSRYGYRMRGEGRMVQSIHRLIELSKIKYFKGPQPPPLRRDLFIKTNRGQMGIFG